jgi:hypothetical protein
MSEITYTEYWQEVNDLAESIVSETMDDNDNDRDAAESDIWDSRLHETVDGHQWVIYYSYNDDVLRHTENEEYYEDNFGADALAESLKQGGISTLKMHMAFWALYADVSDKLNDALDEYEEEAA